jgi:hypothetical protein
MVVKNGKESFVMSGPPAMFIDEECPERTDDQTPTFSMNYCRISDISSSLPARLES